MPYHSVNNVLFKFNYSLNNFCEKLNSCSLCQVAFVDCNLPSGARVGNGTIAKNICEKMRCAQFKQNNLVSIEATHDSVHQEESGAQASYGATSSVMCGAPMDNSVVETPTGNCFFLYPRPSQKALD